MLPILGSTAKYSWQSTAPNVQAYPVCTGTKAPTQNEEVSFNCIIVGERAYGMAIPISGTAMGGEQTLQGIAPFTYQVPNPIAGQTKSNGKPEPKFINKMGMMSIAININAYQGETTIGGSDLYDSFDETNYDSSSAFDNGSTSWGTDTTSSSDLNWNSGSGGSLDPWSTSTETNPQQTNSCPDGSFYCSNNGESNTLFDENTRNGNGYYDSSGVWHEGDNPYSGGSYDSNGVWHSSEDDGLTWNTGDNSNGSGSNTNSGGYYDSDGIWHSNNDDGLNWNSGNGGSGSDSWNNGNGSSYDPWNTGNGGSGSGNGYYDSSGTWHEGTNPYPDGYYDSNGVWHSNDGSNGSNYDPWNTGNGSGSGNGYYDSSGTWHEGTNPYTDGYYDSNGVWHNNNGSTNGYYDSDGIWHNGGSSSGSNYDSSSDNNYGNLLNDLLNSGSGSYNSGDVDWSSSTGGSDGSSTLDDYLNGIGDSDSLDGLTTDLLGVDEDLFNAANNAAEGAENTDDAYDSSWAATDVDGNELYDNAEMWDSNSSSFQDLMNAMDGISGGDDFGFGSDGEGEDANSLSSSLSQFIRSVTGKDDTQGVHGADVTEQDLFEVAKKLLMANGMSLDDILKGKGYDKGSAYTEPRVAWDMNRITKLLSSGKIKPQQEKAQKENKASITNASNRSKLINASKK